MAEFCAGLRELATTSDVVGWNEGMNSLELTGLGDPVPQSVAQELGDALDRFEEMIQSAREISASQMFGDEDRGEAVRFFTATCRSAMVDSRLPKIFAGSSVDGFWGESVSDQLLSEWNKANRTMVSQE